MPSPVWTLTGLQAPAIPVPIAFLNPDADPPVPSTMTSISTGAVNDLSTRLTRNAAAVDAGFRCGGPYGHWFGLDLANGTGLLCSVTAGQRGMDGPVTLPASEAAFALADDRLNYVYMTAGGSLTKQTGADIAAPPTLPAGAFYLGCIPVAAGVQSAPDYGGRLECRGGSLFRRTGDPDLPGDTPPVGIMLLSRSLNSLWFWDGAAWTRTGGYAAAGANADITSLTGLTTALSIAQGGTASTTAAAARAAIGAAVSGANSDIASLTGLTTALSIAQGGTASTTAAAARTALGAAALGANADITSLTGLTTALSIAQGGTASTTAAAARTALGLGTAAVANESAASADAAAAVGAAYVQAEVQAILDELRDLKTKLRTANLLTT